MLKVTHYKRVEEPDSQVVGIVSFYIPEWGLNLNYCRYIRRKNGGFFVGYPSKREEKGSDFQYIPYFNFDKERNDRFQSAAQKAITEYIQKQQSYNNE